MHKLSSVPISFRFIIPRGLVLLMMCGASSVLVCRSVVAEEALLDWMET